MDQPALSAALAADPNVVSVLLATHQPDTSGHCRICRDRGVAPMWPCNLHAAAAAAREYNAGANHLAEGGGTR